MIRSILVPTDGSENALKGVRYAAAMAKQYGAVLHGLHVVDIKLLEGPFFRDISASLGTAPYVNYQGNIAMILEERGQAALKTFEKVCEEYGVKSTVSQTTGIVSRCIVEKSELADLIVMGRSGEHSEWLDELVGSTTQAVVRRAEHPVLVTNTDEPAYNLFVVAYDGSSHARHALHTGADISVNLKTPLHVLVVGEKKGPALLDEARSYLDAYQDLETDYVVRGGDPSEAIIGYVNETGADLLVMGAYGHSKVRELVVGSTTSYALNHAPCPVLFTQ